MPKVGFWKKVKQIGKEIIDGGKKVFKKTKDLTHKLIDKGTDVLEKYSKYKGKFIPFIKKVTDAIPGAGFVGDILEKVSDGEQKITQKINQFTDDVILKKKNHMGVHPMVEQQKKQQKIFDYLQKRKQGDTATESSTGRRWYNW